MANLEKIISAVGSESNLSRYNILRGVMPKHHSARRILIYMAQTECAEEMPKLQELTSFNLTTIKGIYTLACDTIKNSPDFLKRINDVRSICGLPAIIVRKRTPKKKTETSSNADAERKPKPTPHKKSPFGLVYTDLDEIKIREAKRKAAEYMSNYGKGKQPLMDGCIASRKSHG